MGDQRTPKSCWLRYLPKIELLKESHTFIKLQRPADTEAAQWLIQATFIRAFHVYNDFTDGCEQLRCNRGQ